MVSIKGKKGDVTISTVILIVLGLAVLVMLIVGFTKGWGFFFGLFDKAPSDLQQIAEACAVYAQGNLIIDFCSYRQVGDELVNCNDARFATTYAQKGITKKPDCATNDQGARRDACKDAKPSLTFANGDTCAKVLSSTQATSSATTGSAT